MEGAAGDSLWGDDVVRGVGEKIGEPKAVRAWARRWQNPIPIIVPCHRVIGSDGSLTDLAGGWKQKEIVGVGKSSKTIVVS